jgi:thioredoxin reductase (NADPH)
MNPGKKPNEHPYDVIIMGGGPAGLSAAIYASRAGMRTLVLDKNPDAGALSYAERIENYPGFPDSVSGPYLLSLFDKQARTLGAEIVQQQVMGVNFKTPLKEVMTPDNTYSARTVIIATGSMGRNPTIPGEKKFLGKGVSYCATCDAPFFRDRHVALYGEFKNIVHELEHIRNFAEKVYLITPEKELGSRQNKVVDGVRKVSLLTDSNIKKIIGDEVVKGIIIDDGKGNEISIDVSGVFIFIHGRMPVVDYLFHAVETNKDGCVKVNKADMSTSSKGVYAAGDVTCSQTRQVILAVAEGCMAALSAQRFTQ